MTRRFLKQYTGGPVFDATVSDIEMSVQGYIAIEMTVDTCVSNGDVADKVMNKANTIRKNLAQGFYTEDLPLKTKGSSLWSEGE